MNLNQNQHVAFVMMACSVLKSLIETENYLTDDTHLHTVGQIENKIRLLTNLGIKQQMIMYLGGKAGCGKSRVIDSITEFCERWQISDRICICAPTNQPELLP